MEGTSSCGIIKIKNKMPGVPGNSVAFYHWLNLPKYKSQSHIRDLAY